MKIFRYNTISALPGKMKIEEVEVEVAVKDYGDPIVDLSYFTPMAESVRALQAGDNSMKNYDFDSTRPDDGREIPAGRRRGASRESLYQEMLRNEDIVKSDIAEAKRQHEVTERIRKNFDKTSKSVEKTGSTGSQSASK